MTSQQKHKLKNQFIKLSQDEAPISDYNPYSGLSHGIVDSGFNSIISGAGNALTKGYNSLMGVIPKTPISIMGGAARGLGYGVASNALPAAENAATGLAGYTPHSNPMYDGVDDTTRQSLYLNPDQQDPKTRSWGNWLDQSLTSRGGLQDTVNDGAAGRFFGPVGMAAMSAMHAPANLYSDAKGLYNLYNTPKNPNAGLSDQQIIDNSEAGHQAMLSKQGEYEDLKTKVYQLLHKYFNIKPPIPKDEIVTKDVKSSNIKAVGYNPKASLMEVVFKNKTKYRYPFIDNKMYQGFIDSPSKGKYFNEHIKPIGLYEKIATFTINDRSTHSKGLFSPREHGHNPGDFVGLAFKKLGNGHWIKTRLGTKLNHTDKPNVILHNNGTHYYFVAAKKIGPNQEYTADHTTFPSFVPPTTK